LPIFCADCIVKQHQRCTAHGTASNRRHHNVDALTQVAIYQSTQAAGAFTPTMSQGHQIVAGGSYTLSAKDGLAAAKFIEEAASAVLEVSYFNFQS
jgi:hypothetical protein